MAEVPGGGGGGGGGGDVESLLLGRLSLDFRRAIDLEEDGFLPSELAPSSLLPIVPFLRSLAPVPFLLLSMPLPAAPRSDFFFRIFFFLVRLASSSLPPGGVLDDSASAS